MLDSVTPHQQTQILPSRQSVVLDLSSIGPDYIPSDSEAGNENEGNDCESSDADMVDYFVPIPPTDEEIKRSALAEATRPWKEFLSKLPKKPQGWKPISSNSVRSKRINWFNHILWQQINAATIKADWSPQKAIDLLISWNPESFQWLHRQTLSRWIYHVNGVNMKRWLESTLEKAEAGKPIPITNRGGILDPYPDTKAKIVHQLQQVRKTGARITLLSVKVVVTSFVSIDIPG